MIHSLHVLVCILMSTQDSNADEIDLHVKLFLSCCDRFAKSYWDKSKIPFWANTGNFPTLLCLADQRQRHGPIRWFWEGTSERFIQHIKKYLVSMTRTPKYFQTKMRLVYRTNSFEWIREQLCGDSIRDEKFDERPRNYYQYDSLETVEQKLKNGDVLCGFCIKKTKGRVYIAYGSERRSGRVSAIAFDRKGKNNGEKNNGNGIPPLRLELQKKREDAELHVMESLMTSYCIMLPMIMEDKFKSKYTFVYSDWDIGRDDLSKGLPSACADLFSFDVVDD